MWLIETQSANYLTLEFQFVSELPCDCTHLGLNKYMTKQRALQSDLYAFIYTTFVMLQP